MVVGAGVRCLAMRLTCTFALLCLCSCAATYEPRVVLVGGYSAHRVSLGRYVIAADANWFNNVEDAVVFAYGRAQAVCVDVGFATFDVESDRRPGNDCILVVRCTNQRVSTGGLDSATEH